MHEPRIVEVQAPGRVLPARIKREPVDRLTIRAALDALQRHHDRHDHRRHRPPARIAEQISEQLVRRFCSGLLEHQTALWTFTRLPGVPATNYPEVRVMPRSAGLGALRHVALAGSSG
jgi:hypothetical protein